MPDSPAPLVPEKWCQTCYGRTPYLYTYKGKQRCRECLMDILCNGPSPADRKRLLRLLDGPDWAQGELDLKEKDDDG